MLLQQALASYINERPLNREYERQLRDRVTQFEAFHGGSLKISQLTSESLNNWLRHLEQTTKLHPKTLLGYRAAVLAIWNWAYEQRLVDVRPERIRRVRVPRVPPVAFTHQEISSMLAAAMKLPRVVVGTPIRRAAWFVAYIHISYCTALRLADVLALRWSDLRGDRIAIPQNKTGDPVLVQLSPAALKSIDVLPRCSDRILPWPGARTGIFKGMTRIVQLAGVRHGTGRWLRRSAASYIERDRPGFASKLLGHRTPGLCERHYIDVTIATSDVPSPPPLEGVA